MPNYLTKVLTSFYNQYNQYFHIGAVTQISWSHGWGVVAVSSSHSNLCIYSQFVKSLNLEDTLEEKVITKITIYMTSGYYLIYCIAVQFDEGFFNWQLLLMFFGKNLHINIVKL